MNWLLVFFFAVARLLPMLVLWPTIGKRCVPARLRWTGALALAALAASYHGASGVGSTSDIDGILLPLLQELLLGLGMALGCLLLATALQLTGTLIGQMSGLALTDSTDFTGAMGATPLERLFGLLSIAMFLVVDGHRKVVETILASFDRMPPGSRLDTAEASLLLAAMLGHSFTVGLRAAMPIAFALLFSAMVLGMLTRVVPQLASFGFGLNVNIGVTLLVAAVSIGGLASLYRQELTSGFELLINLLPTSLTDG